MNYGDRIQKELNFHKIITKLSHVEFAGLTLLFCIIIYVSGPIICTYASIKLQRGSIILHIVRNRIWENPTHRWPVEIVLPIDMMKLELHLELFVYTFDWIQYVLKQPRFSSHILDIIHLILRDQTVSHNQGYHMHRTVYFKFLVDLIYIIN